MAPPTLDEVIFPEQANHNFSRILGDLKRSNLSISNRLRSIGEDAAFVDDVADALGLPLVANERCGSWYIDPVRKAASAYFKSTDGHTGQWKFSLRRLNLHLLDLIGESGGCIIVDSTRRGKRMPDALSKTIPIWCAVLNRALFPNLARNQDASPLPPQTHDLHTPPDTVSPSESAQITALLPAFLAAFLALRPDLPAAARALADKPLRPVWLTQDDRADLPAFAAGVARLARHWRPVVCCTSSRRVRGDAELAAGGYVQGAGDDTENWARGLTAGVFWRWRRELLAAGEGEVAGLVRELVEREKEEVGGREVVKEAVPGRGVFVGRLAADGGGWEGDEDACVVLLLRDKVTEQGEWVKGTRRLEAGLGKSKAASRALRDALPLVCEFVLRYLRERAEGEQGAHRGKVVVLCESGKDLAISVALAVYCWCFDDAGNVRREDDEPSFNKTAIRVRLGHIVTALPEANPSRATLQSVNSFLMDWRK